MSDSTFEDDPEDGLALVSMPSTPIAENIALQRSSKGQKARRARKYPQHEDLGLPPTSSADSFLEKQSRMLDIQMEHLHEQRGLLLSHLRVRRFNEYLRVALQVLTVGVGVGLVSLLGLAAFNASRDESVVIEPFRTPPELAQRGLDGATVSTLLLDKLKALQEATDSARAASTFRSNLSNELKVEIPQTGISVGDIQRYLREVLGHETHITGEIYRGWTANGSHVANPLYLTVRSGSAAGTTIPGSDTDLSDMIGMAAEQLFAKAQPYRYAVFLERSGRLDEAGKQFEQLAYSGQPEDRAWAYASWAGILLDRTGNIAAAEEKELNALRLDPYLATAIDNIANLETLQGHDEAARQRLSQEVDILGSNRARQLNKTVRPILRAWANARLKESSGDYLSAVDDAESVRNAPDYQGTTAAALMNEAAALALSHDVSASRALLASAAFEPGSAPFIVARDWGSNLLPVLSQQRALGDWRTIAAGFGKAETDIPKIKVNLLALQTFLRPWQAYARAKIGNQAGAEAAISATPLDCYLCVTMRGRIAAEKRDWTGAQAWFAKAAGMGPSLPFAYLAWAEALASKGDLNAAIEKVSMAEQKAPRYADPPELWGEILLRQGDLRRAIGKFRDAAQYAPRWGRLHLMWGRALDRIGRHSEALARYRAAADMDLSAEDRAALPRS